MSATAPAATPVEGLASELVAAGRLAGLFTGRGDDPVTVDWTWFENPVARLETLPTRLGELVALLAGILGTPAAAPPDVFTGAQWYPLPNLDLGLPTAAHVVMSAAGASTGEIGVGLLAGAPLGGATVEAFAYVPLFSYDGGGAHLIAGSTAHPCQIGAYASGAQPFSVTGGSEGTVTFTAVKIEAGIALADAAPTFSLTFEGLTGTAKPAVYTTLGALLDPDVLEWLAALVAGCWAWLETFPGNAPVAEGADLPPTIGDILVAAHFLTVQEPSEQGQPRVYGLDLENLQGDAKTIALNFAFAGLDALASLEDPLIAVPGGGIYVEHTDDDRYGLRVVAQLTLGGGTATSGPAPPAVDLCLGTWLTGETEADNWMQEATGAPADPGLSVLLLSRSGGTPAFAPGFELVSAGVTVRGGANAPLVNVGGVTLAGAELRASLRSSDWRWGVAAGLDGVGFPLGPGFDAAQSGGGNAVASTLVASDGSANAGMSAVNPAFSANAAYVSGFPPVLEIFDPQGARTDLIWFAVQRRFGPLSCQKVGLRVDVTGAHAHDPVLGILFDGDVSLAALDVGLEELEVDIRLREVADPSGYALDLEGLTISFAAGGVEIAGGLVKSVDATTGAIEYDGEAELKAEGIGLAAFGSFASLPGGGTSLFVFAWLDAPLGGPAFFFVTGLAAGFGYNRALKIPGQSDVQTFPLVAGVSNPSLIGGQAGAGAPSPATALAKLDPWVPIERGEYWLAAGVQFTSFEVINGNVLLVVEFGHELVIALLGLAVLQQPAGGTAYVYAALELEVVFRPQEQSIEASAVLATSSYVLTPDAHLTGGFAFATWWGDNPHAGDFVLTLGGYHPAFTPPPYYPREPAVGINWKISNDLVVVGGAYFALTPAAMMAGGSLSVTFSSGALKAWLKAAVDAIVYWKPFHFEADASISVGVSLHLKVAFVDVTLSVEIGADFTLWGPPTGFRVHIDWYVISFTIQHGDDDPPAELTWEEFKGLLPSKTQVAGGGAQAGLAAAEQATTTTPAYVTVTATGGLDRTATVDGLSHWLVRPAAFAFAVTAALPASSVVVTASDGYPAQTLPGLPVAIRGVGGGIPASDYACTQTITVLALSSDDTSHVKACMATSSPCTGRPGGCTDPVAEVDWLVAAQTQNLPQALWGDPVPPGQDPPLNPAGPTVPGTVGATLTPVHPPVTNYTPAMTIAQVFADRVVNADDADHLSISPADRPSGTPPHPADSYADIAHADDPAVASQRAAVFSALQALGVEGFTNAPLGATAADPGHAFADEPMEGALA